MKIKVNAEDNIINVVEYKYPGSKRLPATYPLILTAVYPNQYYKVQPPFNLIGMLLSNPMYLIMGLSFVMMLVFPKMLSGIDPEEMKKLQEEMNMNGNPMDSLKKMVGLDETAATTSDK